MVDNSAPYGDHLTGLVVLAILAALTQSIPIISCKEFPHAHLCLRLAFPGTDRHRLAFPPASLESPGGPATAEIADTS